MSRLLHTVYTSSALSHSLDAEGNEQSAQAEQPFEPGELPGVRGSASRTEWMGGSSVQLVSQVNFLQGLMERMRKSISEKKQAVKSTMQNMVDYSTPAAKGAPIRHVRSSERNGKRYKNAQQSVFSINDDSDLSDDEHAGNLVASSSTTAEKVCICRRLPPLSRLFAVEVGGRDPSTGRLQALRRTRDIRGS